MVIGSSRSSVIAMKSFDKQRDKGDFEEELEEEESRDNNKEE